METRIHEALNETYQNYILPFFWQHGETETVLRTYMKTIQDMGIQAVCLESRPHPDFAGPRSVERRVGNEYAAWGPRYD